MKKEDIKSQNVLQKYLDDNHITKYAVANSGGISRQGLQKATANGKSINNLSVPTVIAVSKALNHTAGNTLNDLIRRTRNANRQKQNSSNYDSYKQKIGLMVRIANDFKNYDDLQKTVLLERFIQLNDERANLLSKHSEEITYFAIKDGKIQPEGYQYEDEANIDDFTNRNSHDNKFHAGLANADTLTNFPTIYFLINQADIDTVISSVANAHEQFKSNTIDIKFDGLNSIQQKLLAKMINHQLISRNDGQLKPANFFKQLVAIKDYFESKLSSYGYTLIIFIDDGTTYPIIDKIYPDPIDVSPLGNPLGKVNFMYANNILIIRRNPRNVEEVTVEIAPDFFKWFKLKQEWKDFVSEEEYHNFLIQQKIIEKK